MKITKCDRCGCEISEVLLSEVLRSIEPKEVKYSITKYIDVMRWDVDLCEDCTNKFKAWMNPERRG